VHVHPPGQRIVFWLGTYVQGKVVSAPHSRQSKSEIFEGIFAERGEIRKVGVVNLADMACVLRDDD